MRATRIAALLFAAIAFAGCLAPKAAVQVGKDLANDAHTAAYTFAASKELAAERALRADAAKAFADLKAQYETQIQSASEGTNDPLTVAQRGSQSVIDYQAGVAATRALLDAKAEKLYKEIAFIRALGDVPPALVKMHDDERAMTEAAFADFVKAGGMEAIHALFDTLEKKYLPAELVPPPTPEPATDTE